MSFLVSRLKRFQAIPDTFLPFEENEKPNLWRDFPCLVVNIVKITKQKDPGAPTQKY